MTVTVQPSYSTTIDYMGCAVDKPKEPTSALNNNNNTCNNNNADNF